MHALWIRLALFDREPAAHGMTARLAWRGVSVSFNKVSTPFWNPTYVPTLNYSCLSDGAAAQSLDKTFSNCCDWIGEWQVFFCSFSLLDRNISQPLQLPASDMSRFSGGWSSNLSSSSSSFETAICLLLI